MKHIAVGAAILASTTLLVTGCSSSSPEPSASAEGETALSGTITYWHAYSESSPEVTTLEDVVIPAFEELHPGVTVKSVAVPYDDLHTKLITALAGDALPDLVRADIAWSPELAYLGVLEPLSESMPDFDEYAAKVYPGPLSTNVWQGTYFGLPLDTNTRVLLTNPEVFAAAGVDVPATFDDMKEIAPALKEAGAFTFADNGASGWNVLPWIWSNGGDMTNEDVTVASGYINSPESVEAIEFLAELFNDEYMPDIILGDTGGLSTSDGFATGAYATILEGPWMYPIFESQFPGFEFEDALVPAGDGGSVSVVGGENIVLTASSTNKEASMEFMRYLLTDEVQLQFAAVGQMPVLNYLGDNLTEVQPYYARFQEQLESAKARPVTPAWNEMNNILQDEIRAAFRGEKTVQEALDAVAEQSDALLAEYNG